jgi:hypothetical protein
LKHVSVRSMKGTSQLPSAFLFSPLFFVLEPLGCVLFLVVYRLRVGWICILAVSGLLSFSISYIVFVSWLLIRVFFPYFGFCQMGSSSSRRFLRPTLRMRVRITLLNTASILILVQLLRMTVLFLTALVLFVSDAFSLIFFWHLKTWVYDSHLRYLMLYRKSQVCLLVYSPFLDTVMYRKLNFSALIVNESILIKIFMDCILFYIIGSICWPSTQQ